MKEKKKDVLFKETLKIINIGLGKFYENIEAQSVEAVQVDWEPPAGGDTEMIEILDQLL